MVMNNQDFQCSQFNLNEAAEDQTILNEKRITDSQKPDFACTIKSCRCFNFLFGLYDRSLGRMVMWECELGPDV